MATICGIKQNHDEVTNFVEKNKIGLPKTTDEIISETQNLIREKFLDKVLKKFGLNSVGLHILQQQLDQESYAVDVLSLLNGVDQHLLYSEFKHLEMTSGASEVKIFKDNLDLLQHIKSLFYRAATKYCIVDTDSSAKVPLVTSKEDLINNIAKFKQSIFTDLINNLGLKGISKAIAFDASFGADNVLYTKVMYAAAEELANHTLSDLDLNNRLDSIAIQILYDVIALNNFDYLLESALGQIVKSAPADIFGNLNRTEYDLTTVSDSGQQDLQGVSDNEYSNASNFVAPAIDKIILQIPKVSYNLGTTVKSKRLYFDSELNTLRIDHVMLLAHWLKLNASLFKSIFGIGNIDFQANPEHSLRECLEAIHDAVVSYSGRTSISKLSLKQLKINDFITKKNSRSEIQTALSLYEYLYNEKDRIYINIRSISQINKLHSGIPRLNIINLIVQLILLVEAPIFLLYDENGLLWDNSDNNTWGDTVIHKAENTNLRYAFLNPIKRVVYSEGMLGKNSEIVSAILNGRRHKNLEAELNDSNKGYLRAIKQFLGVENANDEHIKAILIDAEMQLSNSRHPNVLYTLFKSLATKIREFTPETDSVKNWQKIDTLVSDSIKEAHLNYEIMGLVLGVILNPLPTQTFVTLQGNQIGVYRITSTIHMYDHFRKRYMPATEEELEILKEDSSYLKLRERTNIFVKCEELLEQGDNLGYKSLVAYPLTGGKGDTIKDVVLLPSYVLDKEAFVGDFMSMMMSAKHKNPTTMMMLQLGTYSDKTSLPKIVINALAKMPGNITIQDLVRDPQMAILYSHAFSSMRSLDLVNHILLDWITIFKDYAISVDVNHLTNPSDLKFLQLIQGISSRAGIKDIMISREASELFNEFLQAPSRLDTFDLLMKGYHKEHSLYKMPNNINPASVAAMLNILQEDINLVNEILRYAPESFLKYDVPRIAERKNLKIVDLLHSDVYEVLDPENPTRTITKQLLNKNLIFDLIKDCSPQKLPINIVSELDEFDSLEISPENWDYSMLMSGLSDKTPFRTSFLDYLVQWFDDNKSKVIEMKERVDSSNPKRCSIFDGIYDSNTGRCNKDVVAKIYFGYLITQNFFRHQLIALGVKEPYMDKASKDAKLNILNEIADRLKTSSKRNNTHTASIKPFQMDMLEGVSRDIRICVIDDTSGGVYNTIGADRKVDEFDGVGYVSGEQARMESASLVENHLVETKKTFIVPVNDYSSEELKWASNVISNKKIRESQNSQIPLLSIDERMHSRQFAPEIDLTELWQFPGNKGYLDITSLLGRPYITREGFDYYRYDSLSYDPDNIERDKNGNIIYTITKTKVDIKTGKALRGKANRQSYKVQINNLHDFYKVLNGIDCGSFHKGRFVYNEDIMDLRYQLIIKVGKRKPGTVEYTQSAIDLPLRQYFTSILTPKSAVKRGAANVVPGEAWTNPNIPLSTSIVSIATGGKQLDAEHESDGSLITKGTQLMQDLTQNGYNPLLVNNIYEAIAHVMLNSSLKFNELVELINLPDIDIESIQVLLSELIEKNLIVDGTSENLLNMIVAFRKDYEEKGLSFILPLSAITKEVIKSYAPELNKNVIKQLDSGLMGTLTGADGFIQTYSIGGKIYTTRDFLEHENIHKLRKPYQAIIEQFLSNHPNISFDEVIITLSLLEAAKDLTSAVVELGGNEDLRELVLSVLEIVTDRDYRLQKAVESFKELPERSHFLGYKKVKWSQVKPGETIINLFDSAEDLNVIPKEVLIDSSAKLLDLSETTEYVLVDTFTPTDLQPQFTEIATEGNKNETEYTTFEALLGARLNRMLKMDVPLNKDVRIFSSLISYLYTVTNDSLYKELANELNQGIVNKGKKSLFRFIQEKCANFVNHAKFYGFTFPNLDLENPNFVTYYHDFNPLEDFTELIKLRVTYSYFTPESSVLIISYINESRKADSEGRIESVDSYLDKILLKPEYIDFLRRSIQLYLTYGDSKKSDFLESVLSDTSNRLLAKLVLEHPVFIYMIQEGNNLHPIKEYLGQLGFDKIITSELKKALIIMPNIYRKVMKSGSRNVTNISPETFKADGAKYDIREELFNADFIIRTDLGLYNIVFVNDITDPYLDIFGKTIPEAEISIKDGYRISSKNKQQLYKLPEGLIYNIRTHNGVDTIIIHQSAGISSILDLLESDLNLVTIEPILHNISKNRNNIPITFIEEILHLNTMPPFNKMYEYILTEWNNQSDITSPIKELHNSLKEEYIKTYQNLMYASFRKALGMIATRIPTQNMSSIMPMEVVSFIDSDVNDVFVTKWLNWLMGSDFD